MRSRARALACLKLEVIGGPFYTNLKIASSHFEFVLNTNINLFRLIRTNRCSAQTVITIHVKSELV